MLWPDDGDDEDYDDADLVYAQYNDDVCVKFFPNDSFYGLYQCDDVDGCVFAHDVEQYLNGKREKLY